MKSKKKSITIIAFVLGTMLLMTAAFADMMLGSGYNMLKDAAKTTAAKLSSEVENFSTSHDLTIKLDGNIIEETSAKSKFDTANNTRESHESYFKKGKTRESYWYNDREKRIYENDDGSYEVYEKKQIKGENQNTVQNPFEDEQTKDMEKILDAFVGSLKDIIQVEELGDKKMYIGNLNEAQIPSLVNAISSFVLKYSILEEYTAEKLGVPYPKSNIYLVNAMGKAIENKDGIIESGIFTASMSYEDGNGEEHIYSLDFAMDIKDINTTVVREPDLKGKKVNYSKEGFEFGEKYIGKYKNDIVIESGNTFEKIGERFVEINSIENGNIKGKYYEVYKEGHKAEEIKNFEFYSNYDDSPYHFTIIQYTDNNGEGKRGILERNDLHNINISFDTEIDERRGGYSYTNNINGFSDTFIRIFD